MSNSTDDNYQKPFTSDVPKKIRRSPRINSSLSISYNEESGLDEDVKGRESSLKVEKDYFCNDSVFRQCEQKESHKEPWEQMYQELVSFKKQHGHCSVPFLTPKLGNWVQTQRRQCKDSDRVKNLNRLGFFWNVKVDLWNEKFEELKKFKRANGHLKVPTNNVLGKWVSKQRLRCTDPIRRGKLDSIGFIWDVLEHQFQDKYNELVEYKKRHGHCEVPFKYGPLGLWCNDLRMRGCKKPARREKLTKLGFRWDKLYSQKMVTTPKLINEKKIAAEKNTKSDDGNLRNEVNSAPELVVKNSIIPMITIEENPTAEKKRGGINRSSNHADVPIGNTNDFDARIPKCQLIPKGFNTAVIKQEDIPTDDELFYDFDTTVGAKSELITRGVNTVVKQEDITTDDEVSPNFETTVSLNLSEAKPEFTASNDGIKTEEAGTDDGEINPYEVDTDMDN